MSPWETWCGGVLKGISAPINAVNVDTLWAWSNAETAPYDLLRWDNPMNTTEKWSGSRDSGAQPGNRDVQIYASLQDGCDATVYTLIKEPYYGAIVANLRNSVPRQKWGVYSTAGSELHAWGTGTNWLTATPYFGAPPTSLIGDDMTSEEHDLLVATAWRVVGLLSPDARAVPYALKGQVTAPDLLAAIKAIPAGSAGSTDLTPVLAAITLLKADVDALHTKLDNAGKAL